MSKLKQSFLTITIGLALAAGISYGWNPPTAVPPNNNASAPINVSGITQNFVDSKTLKVKEGFGALNLRGALRVDGVFQLVDGTQYEGFVLTSDAEGKASWKSGGVSGGVVPFTRVAVFDSSASWTVPVGVSQIMVEAWGGGGGGGEGCAAEFGVFGGTGGGGGGYGKGIYSVTAGEVYSINVGLGGKGSKGSNGKNGNETRMARQSNGAVIISATGGAGGADDGNFPGVGGVSTGMIKIAGGSGDDADVDNNGVYFSNGARGGSAGNGGQGGGETEAYAVDGGVPGGGGGGGACRRSGTLKGWFNGGDGANGRVVVWY